MVGSECSHDNYGLLDAWDDWVWAPQKGQG